MKNIINKHIKQFARVGSVRPNPLAKKTEKPITKFIMGLTDNDNSIFTKKIDI